MAHVLWEVDTDKGWMPFDSPTAALLEAKYIAGQPDVQTSVRLSITGCGQIKS